MLNITIGNLQKRLPIPRKRIRNLILKVIKGEDFNKSGYINICFIEDRLIKKLNHKYLRLNNPTYVLAFNLAGNNNREIMADIAISTDTAIRNACIFKTTVRDELLRYVAHGILHVLGYNDRSKIQVQLMHKKENIYVNR